MGVVNPPLAKNGSTPPGATAEPERDESAVDIPAPTINPPTTSTSTFVTRSPRRDLPTGAPRGTLGKGGSLGIDSAGDATLEDGAVAATDLSFLLALNAAEMADAGIVAFSPSTVVGARPVATAYALSFSPTQLGAYHCPPAMPRMTRCAFLQRRTGALVLSRGIFEANPGGTFGRACTKNGFEGGR